MLLKILLLTILLSNQSMARDMWTTRLISTSGSGVASMLVEETPYLNPAPIAFFDKTHFYYQNYGQKIEDKNSSRSGSLNQMDEINGDSITIVDTKNTFKGAFSYQSYRYNLTRRSRYVLTFGKASGQNSAFGISIRHTRDKHPDVIRENEESFTQAVLGTSHVINKNFTVGAVIIDPLGKIEEESRALVGFQYIFSNAFLISSDFGGNPRIGLSDSFISRSGLQINFMKQIFLRLGFFSDKAENTRGDSYGINWVGPKTSFEFAVKNSTILDDSLPSLFAFVNERVIESSLSFSLRY
jgi:hypothetical protein